MSQAVSMTREHWVQVAAIVLPLVLTGITMFVGTTWYLSEHIESIRETDIQANDVLLARLAADEQRISNAEKDIINYNTSMTSFEAEERSFNGTLNQALADLKVQIAGKEDLKHR